MTCLILNPMEKGSREEVMGGVGEGMGIFILYLCSSDLVLQNTKESHLVVNEKDKFIYLAKPFEIWECLSFSILSFCLCI